MDEDVIPTLTVEMLHKKYKGNDRHKQLIGLDTRTGEYVDFIGSEMNEDNLVLGTEANPVEEGGGRCEGE